MKLGKVVGTVWAVKKSAELRGCRLLMVQPLSGSREHSGTPLVAADPENIGGTGDIVVYVTSTDAVEAFASGRAPVDASIVCLVDSMSGA